MSDLRSLKLDARRRLHDRMSLPAFYYDRGDADADPITVRVRRHTEFGEQGDIKGTSYAYAEKEAETPKLIFWNAEVVPKRASVVMFAEGEGFRIDTTLPKYGQTTTVRATRLSAADADLYDFPPPVV